MNASNHSMPVFDGQFYLKDHGNIYIPYFVLSTMGIVFGTIGNLSIIMTILFSQNLRVNPAYMAMMNLALSDLGISLFVHTFIDVGIFLGENFYTQRPGLCTFLAVVCSISCRTSLFNMGMLAINRYINICHNSLYKKAFTFKKTLGFCVLTWIAGFLFDIPNFVGWGGHLFDPKSVNCAWDRLANHSYSLFVAIFAIFLPCICILICYMRIFVVAFKSKQRVGNKTDMIQSLKMARSLFASFSLYAICWLPYGIIVSVDYGDEMPITVHAVSTFLAHINSALNPVIYILFNPVFKASFYKVMGRCFCVSLKSNTTFQANSTNTSKLNLSQANQNG